MTVSGIGAAAANVANSALKAAQNVSSNGNTTTKTTAANNQPKDVYEDENAGAVGAVGAKANEAVAPKKELSPQEYEDVKQLQKKENFNAIAKQDGKSGTISKEDVKKGKDNQNLSEEQRALCQRLYDNPDFFDKLDTASFWGRVKGKDGEIGKADISAAAKWPKTEQETKADPLDGIENCPGAPGNADQAVDFLMAKGLTLEQAVAIATNINYESSFNPSAENNNEDSFGICQWRNSSAPRRDNMEAWMAENGYELNSFKGQLEFLWHELETAPSTYVLKNNNVLNDIKKTDSAYEAARLFCEGFENPQEDEGARRGKAAEELLINQKQRLGMN